MQAGCALLDFCTEYGEMLITFFTVLLKKSYFITIWCYTGFPLTSRCLCTIISEMFLFFAGMSFYKQLMLMLVGMTASYCGRSQLALSGWATTNNQIALSRKIIYQIEASFRSNVERKHLQTFLFRTGAFVQLNNRWSLGVGYVLIDNRRTVDGVTGYAVEHQGMEQAWFSQPVYFGPRSNAHKTLLRHRLRLENRFLPRIIQENNTIHKIGTSFANRLRYQIREQIPLAHNTGDFEKGTYLILQNEFFFNISGQRYVNGKVFDQNRSLVATGYRFSRKIDLELSYMLRAVKEASNRVTRESIVQVTTFARI